MDQTKTGPTLSDVLRVEGVAEDYRLAGLAMPLMHIKRLIESGEINSFIDKEVIGPGIENERLISLMKTLTEAAGEIDSPRAREIIDTIDFSVLAAHIDLTKKDIKQIYDFLTSRIREDIIESTEEGASTQINFFLQESRHVVSYEIEKGRKQWSSIYSADSIITTEKFSIFGNDFKPLIENNCFYNRRNSERDYGTMREDVPSEPQYNERPIFPGSSFRLLGKNKVHDSISQEEHDIIMRALLSEASYLLGQLLVDGQTGGSENGMQITKLRENQYKVEMQIGDESFIYNKLTVYLDLSGENPQYFVS